MPKAIWNGQVLADSKKTVIVEGNHYFPPESIAKEYFEKSQTETICPWKGTSKYFHIKVEGKVNVDAAWTIPQPKEAAKHIKNHVAFWRGVEIVE